MRCSRNWIKATFALSLSAVVFAGPSQAMDISGEALLFYCAPDFDKGVLIVVAMEKSGNGTSALAKSDNVGKSCAKTSDEVRLVGFGTFSVSHRQARRGINPQTGAPIQIAASKKPFFKAGKGLKDAVNRSSAMLVCGGPLGQQLVEIIDRGDDATLQEIIANETRCVDAIALAAREKLLMHGTLGFLHYDCSTSLNDCDNSDKTLVILRNVEEAE